MLLGLAGALAIFAVVLAAYTGWSKVFGSERRTTAEIILSPRPDGEINPDLYGVNYVWHLVPESEFPDFSRTMHNDIGATLGRYPGGWAAELYDWDANCYGPGPDGSNVLPDIDMEALAQTPGVDPETFLSAFPRSSFVTPSAAAIFDPQAIAEVAQYLATLVSRYGQRVKIWEIGNEWWLQRGAKTDSVMRAQNLQRYAALVAAAAPAMKAADPSVTIYVTGEWTHPEDFATLRQLVGEQAWKAVDGSSIHPYCGNNDPETLCSLLPQRAQSIRAASSRDLIFASEWSLGPKVTTDDFGIRNANQMIGAFRFLVDARIQAATYWPAVRSVPEIVLTSRAYTRTFATGMLFSLMSRYYRGSPVATSGSLPSAAARSDAGTSLFIATMGSRFKKVQIPLLGTGLNQVVSAKVLYAKDIENPKRARLAKLRALPVQMLNGKGGGLVVECDINPGTSGRGAGWEIIHLVLN